MPSGTRAASVSSKGRWAGRIMGGLFPIHVALLIWGALFLRDPELRELIPLKG